MSPNYNDPGQPGWRVPHDPLAFDLPAETVAGVVGAEQADSRKSSLADQWRTLADDAHDRVCLVNEYVVSDHVWEILSVEWDRPLPLDGRAMSAVMTRGAKRGNSELHIVDGLVVQQKSAKKGCHAHPRAVWRSLIWTGV